MTKYLRYYATIIRVLVSHPRWFKTARNIARISAFGPPKPPKEWGPGWEFGISTPADVLPGEAARRIRWAKNAGLLESRRKEPHSFVKINAPDWWEKAGEALRLLREEAGKKI